MNKKQRINQPGHSLRMCMSRQGKHSSTPIILDAIDTIQDVSVVLRRKGCVTLSGECAVDSTATPKKASRVLQWNVPRISRLAAWNCSQSIAHYSTKVVLKRPTTPSRPH